MKFIGLGFLIPSAIAVGYFMGSGLDRLFHTHFLYIVFLLLGAVGGLVAMVREAQREIRRGMEFRYDRVARWISVVGVLGAAASAILAGPLAAAAFILGALGSWWNYRYLVEAVTAITASAAEGSSPRAGMLVAGLLLRFLVLGAAAIAILKYSRNDGIALGFGLLASFFAICLELLYGRLWNSTKSG